MVYAVESPSYTYEGYYAVPTNPKQVPQATAKAEVQATTQGTFQTMYASQRISLLHSGLK